MAAVACNGPLYMWADLSPRQANELLAAPSSLQCRDLLRTALFPDPGPPDAHVPLSVQDECRLDMFYHAAVFARRKGLQADQVSVLHTLLRVSLEQCTATPFDNLDVTLASFNTALLRHSVQRPPFSEAVFPLQTAQVVQAYALDTLFRHFKLYKYAMTRQPRLTLALPADSMATSPEPMQETGEAGPPGTTQEDGAAFNAAGAASADVGLGVGDGGTLSLTEEAFAEMSVEDVADAAALRNRTAAVPTVAAVSHAEQKLRVSRCFPRAACVWVRQLR